MAGLVSNSIGKSRSRTELPMFPLADTTLWPYFGCDQPEGAYANLPGFAGGTAGRCIRILMNSNTSFVATLYNIDGTAATDGVCNGGMTIAEAAGSANADHFVGACMDATDQVLYMLFNDTGTSPDTLYFSKVNEAGTVTAIGNAQVANTSFDGFRLNNSYMGALHRKGGDGSGDFAIYWMHTAGGSSAYGLPYRGSEVTIATSNGALSYANFMPTTFGSTTPTGYYPRVGPTSNNIVGSFASSWGSTGTGSAIGGSYGNIWNRDNGKAITNSNMGHPYHNGVPWGTGYGTITFRCRGYYVFSQYYAVQYGQKIYKEEDVHTWLDEMAVYYGIL